jgi:hypothetical protein
MIRDWSPEARLVLGFIVAPLAVPMLFTVPYLIGMINTTSIRRNWSLPLVVLIVGAVTSYSNALVVAAPLWIIVGRSRLVRNHWPLTIGGTLSGITTVVLFASRRDMTYVSFGAVAGFLTALLFWVIALREVGHLRTEKESTAMGGTEKDAAG